MKCRRITAVCAVTLLALSQAVAARQPAPERSPETAWFGTWHLDAAKSTYDPGPAPYRRGTWAIVRDGDAVKMVYDLVGVRGGVTHMEWRGRFDGTGYALQGPDVRVGYAYTQVDSSTLELLVTIDQQPAVRGTVVLSPDGRTITARTTQRNARGVLVTSVAVYEKK